MTCPEIPGQQSIPVSESTDKLSRCAWCGERATTTIELEPAQHTFRKGPSGKKIKLVKRRAIEAPVCPHHFNTLERVERVERGDVA